MWSKYIVILILLPLILSERASQDAESTSIDGNVINITKNENINKTEITQSEIRLVPKNNNTVIHSVKEENSDNDPAVEPAKHVNFDVNEFYYWILVVGSSLTILGLIIFKSFRMRRSRAEIRYGRPTDTDEIEPLGRTTNWDDVTSSENEDEIFDINFLKNTRLQKHSDNN